MDEEQSLRLHDGTSVEIGQTSMTMTYCINIAELAGYNKCYTRSAGHSGCNENLARRSFVGSGNTLRYSVNEAVAGNTLPLAFN